ncbi:MAG: hypothetical protein V1833_05725 [Elusimicrobiota bacterium]
MVIGIFKRITTRLSVGLIILLFLILFIVGNILWFVVASKKQNTLIGKTISIFKKERNVVIKITLPTGEIVELKRASKISPTVSKDALPITLTGKIELASIDSIHTNITRVVLVSDDGQLIMLVNPPIVNGLRMSYIGRYVKLKGYWQKDVPFLGRMRRCIWVENVE